MPDTKKDGGSFHEIAGTVRRVDTVNKTIVITSKESAANETVLKLADVVNIGGDVFAELECNFL